MTQGYLAQESKRANEATKKMFSRAGIAYVVLIAILYFLMRDSFDLNDPSCREIFSILKILTVVVFLALAVRLFRASRVAMNGENLVLPFEEGTKQAVGQIIDQEVLEGKIQVEEYIYEIEEGKKPHGEKIVLTPSYLLLCGDRMKVTAIPRDKIYWICAQVGQKGGPFIVRILIFTEKKIFNMTGVDIEHVERIAEKIHQYMPDIFSDYDPFFLSYELEKLYAKNREEFLVFYEKEKRKHETIQ